MTGLPVGVSGCAGARLMPRDRQANRNVADRQALPWSHTIVSGTITGRAAAASSRSSIAVRP
jgi:hypothetical protein